MIYEDLQKDNYSSESCQLDHLPYAGTIILNVMISSLTDLIVFSFLNFQEILLLFYQIIQVQKYVQKCCNGEYIDKTIVIINLLNIIISYMYIFTFTFYIFAFIIPTQEWKQLKQIFILQDYKQLKALNYFLSFYFIRINIKMSMAIKIVILSQFQLLLILYYCLEVGSHVFQHQYITFVQVQYKCIIIIKLRMNYFKLAQCGVSIIQNIYFFYKEYKAKIKLQATKDIKVKKIFYLLFILIGLLAIITFYIIRVLNNYSAFYIKFKYNKQFPGNIGVLSNFDKIKSPYDIKNNYIWPIIFTLYIVLSSILPRLLIIQINTSSTSKSSNYSLQNIAS